MYVQDDIFYDEISGVNINITGIVSTCNVDVNGPIDVDGLDELDDVNAGVQQFSALVDINGGLQTHAIIEDLTDNRVVIAGTGGELEDDANLTFNGTQLAVGVDLDVDGRTEHTTNMMMLLLVLL